MSNRINELRKQHNMTQKELAALLGVCASTVGMYEQSRRTPDIETYIKLADIFNVSIDYMVGHSNDKNDGAAELSKHIAQGLKSDEAISFNADSLTLNELEELEVIIQMAIQSYLSKND